MYDNAINYWSVDQVMKMYEYIKTLESLSLDEHVEDFCINEKDLEILKSLKDDIKKLSEKFKEYVDHHCILRVF